MKIHLKDFEAVAGHAIGDEIRKGDTIIRSWCGLTLVKDKDDYEFITNDYRKVTCKKCLSYGEGRIKFMKIEEERSVSRFEL